MTDQPTPPTEQPTDQPTPPATGGADPAAADELERLRRHNRQLLDEAKAAKTMLQNLQSTVESLQSQQQAKTQESESELETIKRQLASLQAERDAAKAEAEKAEFYSGLKSRFSAPKYQIYNPDQIIQLFGSKIEESETGLIYRDGSRAIPLDTWIDTIKTDSNYQNLFRAPASGAGGDPAGRSVVPTANPFKTGNLTEQMRLFKTDRAAYDRLKSEAGK